MNNRASSLATLALLFSVVTLASQAGAQDQQPEILWSQRAGFQPIDIKTGDLNGDSRPDVVVGYSEPAILAIDSGGDVLWRFETRHWVWQVAVGDIDGDGKDDVAGYESGQPSYLYAISGSGMELWRYQLPITGSGNEHADHVKIGDVTGDGRNEVIVGADASSTLFVFDNQGSVLFSYSVPSFIPSIELADVTEGDGLEIVISYGYSCTPCGVQVIDGLGNLLWNFSTPVRLGQVVAGDLNDDGKADVVVGEWDIEARNVYAIDSSGSFLWKFEQGEPVFGLGEAALALGDIDHDGRLDVVLGSSDHNIYVITANGQGKWTFDTGSDISQIAVGDLDGDGRNEIAASTIGPPSVWPRTGIYAIDSDGSQLWFFPKSNVTAVQGFHDLVIADVNDDRRADVVAVQHDIQRGDYGLVFALSTPRAQHITVSIDIKPGGVPNSINPRSRGMIPVAILSSPTFDALSNVDTGSLTFGRTGDEPSLAFCNPEDVNGDGLLDVVCHFHTETTGFVAGDIQGVLKGKTRGGVPINGTDSVRIVP